ncbi:hypothetical protein [Clostridium sp. LP20]|uniref:hypothetical protein n=1 Tax=Clostridium sp. LP20 TaxID=3418665 RepID=UPI003EE5CBF5
MGKKRGNSILLVLVVAMMIIVLGATMVTAVTYTTKMNKITQDETDLLISAENGLEYGASKLYNGVLIDEESTDLNASDKILKVKIKATANPVDINKVTIGSTSYGKNGKELTVSTIYNKTNNPLGVGNDIFKFGIAAGDKNIEITGNGAINNGSTSINSALPVEESLGGSYGIPAHEESNTYEALQFISNFKHKDKVSVGKIGQLIDGQFTDENNVKINSRKLTVPIINGQSLGDINGVCSFVSDGYTIILVNASKLVINLDGAEPINKTILMCSGEIVIQPDLSAPGNGGGTIDGTNSTIYGGKVLVDERGTLDIKFSPKKGLHSANGHELDDSKLLKVEGYISKLIPNFGASPSLPPGGGGGASGTWVKEPDSYIKH